MDTRVELAAVVILVMSFSLVAADESNGDPPDLELLEFLAEWADEDVGSLDPEMFEDDFALDETQVGHDE